MDRELLAVISPRDGQIAILQPSESTVGGAYCRLRSCGLVLPLEDYLLRFPVSEFRFVRSTDDLGEVLAKSVGRVRTLDCSLMLLDRNSSATVRAIAARDLDRHLLVHENRDYVLDTLFAEPLVTDEALLAAERFCDCLHEARGFIDLLGRSKQRAAFLYWSWQKISNIAEVRDIGAERIRARLMLSGAWRRTVLEIRTGLDVLDRGERIVEDVRDAVDPRIIRELHREYALMLPDAEQETVGSSIDTTYYVESGSSELTARNFVRKDESNLVGWKLKGFWQNDRLDSPIPNFGRLLGLLQLGWAGSAGGVSTSVTELSQKTLWSRTAFISNVRPTAGGLIPNFLTIPVAQIRASAPKANSQSAGFW